MSSNPPAAHFEIVRADLDNPDHASAIVDLLDHYARDIRGGGTGLSARVKGQVVPGLRAHPGTCVFLAYSETTPLGGAVCLRGYSTFRAAPLLNIHDLAVHASARGRGIGRALLKAVQQEATRQGCCRITLEVRADNHVARNLYVDFGFEPGDPGSTAMSFLTKHLDTAD